MTKPWRSARAANRVAATNCSETWLQPCRSITNGTRVDRRWPAGRYTSYDRDPDSPVYVDRSHRPAVRPFVVGRFGAARRPGVGNGTRATPGRAVRPALFRRRRAGTAGRKARKGWTARFAPAERRERRAIIPPQGSSSADRAGDGSAGERAPCTRGGAGPAVDVHSRTGPYQGDLPGQGLTVAATAAPVAIRRLVNSRWVSRTFSVRSKYRSTAASASNCAANAGTCATAVLTA